VSDASTVPAQADPSVPRPVLPDFTGACIANVVPALMARDTAAPPTAWLPDTARRARQIVLLVVDGLGWEQLSARAGLAPTLSSADGIGRPITSVAPSTTATALTSITTGRLPYEHGVLGYRLADGDEILNVLRWRVGNAAPRDARRSEPAGAFQPFAPFPGSGAPVPVVSRDEFGSTGFTAAHLGDSPLHGYRVPSSLPVEVGRLLDQGEPFVYAYYDGIDKIAHGNGLGDHYDAELRAVDRMVGDLVGMLPAGAALVVTADHGQIDVGTRLELLGRDTMASVRFLSGEGRFRWLHAREGAAADLADELRGRYGDSTWVMTRDQMLEDGLFGGTPEGHLLARLGDVALLPHRAIAFIDPADTGESRLESRHGSLTSAEMLVPLLALSGDGSI
jgi:hypothetical protein